MGIGDVGNVPLQAPIDLSQVSESEIEQAAGRIKQGGDTTLSKDQIVKSLTYLQENGVKLEQKHIDRIHAGEPVLTPSENLALSNAVLSEIRGNPWLKPNPLVTININTLELAHLMSQIKLQEAQEAAASILQMRDLAKEIAELIIEIGKAEATMHYVSAAMSFASAATGLVGGAANLAKGGDSSAVMQRSQMLQSAQGIFQGADSIVKGIFTARKASLEALKTITENMLKTAERRLNAASDAYKQSDEMITQILQQLQKIVDEAYKAHGWQTH